MASISQRGDSWYIHYIDDGRRIRKSLGKITQAQAEKVRRRIELELAHGAQLLMPRQGPLLQQFAPEYVDWYASEHPSSYKRVAQIIESHLIKEFGLMPMDAIEPRQVEAWKAKRKQAKAKPETIIKELRTLKAMLNRAVDWEVIDRNPIARVKEPKNVDSKPPRWYTTDDMRALYEASPHHAPIWQLMANTGLRRGEALNLREDHRKPDRLVIVSEDGARTKSGKWREIPLNGAAIDALDNLALENGYYLPRVNPVSLTRAFGNCARRAKIGGNLHCLRHTYCSHLVMAGVPLRTVQMLAGHAHFSTTEKYAHLAPEHLADSAHKISL